MGRTEACRSETGGAVAVVGAEGEWGFTLEMFLEQRWGQAL